MANGNKNAIRVSDLGLASVLVTLGARLQRMERDPTDRKRIHFHFESSREVEAVIKWYWADQTISIPIQTLFNNQKMLKNRIYSMR